MTTVLLTDVIRGCYHDGPGYRTVVNFKGCPLRCAWCHSPHTWSFSRILWHDKSSCMGCELCVEQCPKDAIHRSNADSRVDVDFSSCDQCLLCTTVCPTRSLRSIGESWEVSILTDELMRDKTLFDKTGGGVTLSGGECLAQPIGAYELLRKLRELGVHTTVDTGGAVPCKNLNRVIPVTNLFLFDIKILDAEQHKEFTGVSNEAILDNLHWLAHEGARVQVRSPVVPGINNSPEFRRSLSELCNSLRIAPPEFLPFNVHAADRYEKIGVPFTYPSLIMGEKGTEKGRR